MAKYRPTKESMNPPDPKSPAAVQKHAGEQFCKVFSELYGIETVCLRYFNVFGPGEYGDSPYATLVAGWLESLHFPKNKKASIEGNGAQSRDFCYVDDVVRANILAMRSRKRFAGDAMNIASGKAINVREVRKVLEQASGKKLDLIQKPPRKGDVRHTHADITKAKKMIGYTPKVTFPEGVARTAAWFKARNR
jgi:nucleoside-diphosphate-sugar epimerase